MTEIIVLPAAEYRADRASIQDQIAQLQRTVEALLNAPQKSKWMPAAEVCGRCTGKQSYFYSVDADNG